MEKKESSINAGQIIDFLFGKKIKLGFFFILKYEFKVISRWTAGLIGKDKAIKVIQYSIGNYGKTDI